MQNNQQKPPTSLTSSLSRAFLQSQNVLLLHSRGIDIMPALAQALYLQKSHLTLLIDFHQIEVQQLNYHLHQIKQEKILLKDDIRGDKPEVFMLNKVIREKRRKMYVSGGIYAITQQILIMDCLSDTQELSPGLISKIMIKDAEYGLNDKFSLTAWICTILGLGGNKTAITAISSRPASFQSSNLETYIRLLYTKKLILWPFGRSEIHQLLTKSSLTNRNHKLLLNFAQQNLHNYLVELLRYNQKFSSKNDKKQIETLIYSLLNIDKLNYLAILQNIVNYSHDYSIWKSSNTNIIQIIDRLVTGSRNCVYNLLLVKNNQMAKTQQNELVQQKNQEEEEYYNQTKPKTQQNNLREIDLSSLIPKQVESEPNKKPQPSITNTLYKLQYELHVPGLAQLQVQKSQLFPAKLLQIIRQVKTSWHQDINNKMVVYSEEDERIHRIIDQQLQRIKNRVSQQSLNQNKCLSQIKQDKKQEYQEVVDQKQTSNKADSNKKLRKSNQKMKEKESQNIKEADFSSYQFGRVFKSAEKIQNATQQRNPCEFSQNKQKQTIKDKFFEIDYQSQSSQVLVKQQKKTEFQTTNLKNFQQQRLIYICTASQQLNKHLHYSIFCYENKLHYIAYIRKLYNYLTLKLEDRTISIKKLIKRLNNPTSSKSSLQKMLILEHQPILLQELYNQLKKVNQVIDKFSAFKEDIKQRDCLFENQIQRLQCRYVLKQGLKLWKKDYNPVDDVFITLTGKQYDCKVRFVIQTHLMLHQLNRNLRVLAPQNIYFYTPNTSFIRHINIAYAQGSLLGIQQLHTIYFNNSIQSDKVIKIVKEQDEAFWHIAQERKKLGEYIESPQVRIKQLIIDDQIQKKAKMIALASATQAKNSRNQMLHIQRMHTFSIERIVLIDKRQFKSLLPSYLFHHGFKIIPVFLENADYILSNDVAIQKKSVHTRDLHQSLKSGRLQQQVKRLCSKFARPYLLIQCPNISYFKKQQFSYGFNNSTGQKYSFNVRKQLAQIIHKYPKINLIWSTSYLETVKYFIQLKKNREEPDLNKFKPQSEQEEIEMLENDEKDSNGQEIF